MIQSLPGLALLNAGCTALYLGLAALILTRRPWSRTGVWLSCACLATALWSGTVAVAAGYSLFGAPDDQFEVVRSAAQTRLGSLASWLEIARSAAWYGFILHLYRRLVTTHRQISQAFTTMGLLAVLVVGGLPLFDCCRTNRWRRSGRSVPPSGSASPSATSCCSKTSISTRRAMPAGTSTCSASRWAGCSSTTSCSTRTPCCSGAFRSRCSKVAPAPPRSPHR